LDLFVVVGIFKYLSLFCRCFKKLALGIQLPNHVHRAVFEMYYSGISWAKAIPLFSWLIWLFWMLEYWKCILCIYWKWREVIKCLWKYVSGLRTAEIGKFSRL